MRYFSEIQKNQWRTNSKPYPRRLLGILSPDRRRPLSPNELSERGLLLVTRGTAAGVRKKKAEDGKQQGSGLND